MSHADFKLKTINWRPVEINGRVANSPRRRETSQIIKGLLLQRLRKKKTTTIAPFAMISSSVVSSEVLPFSIGTSLVEMPAVVAAPVESLVEFLPIAAVDMTTSTSGSTTRRTTTNIPTTTKPRTTTKQQKTTRQSTTTTKRTTSASTRKPATTAQTTSSQVASSCLNFNFVSRLTFFSHHQALTTTKTVSTTIKPVSTSTRQSTTKPRTTTSPTTSHSPTSTMTTSHSTTIPFSTSKFWSTTTPSRTTTSFTTTSTLTTTTPLTTSISSTTTTPSTTTTISKSTTPKASPPVTSCPTQTPATTLAPVVAAPIEFNVDFTPVNQRLDQVDIKLEQINDQFSNVFEVLTLLLNPARRRPTKRPMKNGKDDNFVQLKGLNGWMRSNRSSWTTLCPTQPTVSNPAHAVASPVEFNVDFSPVNQRIDEVDRKLEEINDQLSNVFEILTLLLNPARKRPQTRPTKAGKDAKIVQVQGLHDTMRPKPSHNLIS